MLWKRTHGAVKFQKDSLTHRGGRVRASAPRPYIRHACGCAELGSSFRHIALFLPVERVPASLAPGLGDREWEDTRIF